MFLKKLANAIVGFFYIRSRGVVMGRTVRAAVVSSAVLVLTLTLTGTGAAAATPRLSSQLIGAAQFPKGWSVANYSGTVHAGCLSGVIGLSNVLKVKGEEQTASASVLLEKDESVPLFSEMLGTYSNVTSAYSRIVTALVACKHVHGQVFGTPVNGSMKEMNFKHFGNASEAFFATTSVMGATFDEDLVIVRKGNVVVGLVEGGLPPVSTHQLQGFISQALAKVH
jgi:hypothetical protein